MVILTTDYSQMMYGHNQLFLWDKQKINRQKYRQSTGDHSEFGLEQINHI